MRFDGIPEHQNALKLQIAFQLLTVCLLSIPLGKLRRHLLGCKAEDTVAQLGQPCYERAKPFRHFPQPWLQHLAGALDKRKEVVRICLYTGAAAGLHVA
jgi:hypothetical protein